MIGNYIFPVLIFSGMGLIAGIMLTAASKIFAVSSDPRTDRVYEALPHINCGACGYKGCGDYAAAVVQNGERVDLCRPGGGATAEKVAGIMGISAGKSEKKTAVVRCLGSCEIVKTEFEYNGDRSCRAAKRLYGGMKGCKYGCIGFGDCASECPVNAIAVKDSLACVDPERCIGCELCTKICPNGIIEMRGEKSQAQVICSSHDFGKSVKAVCSAGCIGCGICEKCCNYDAAHVIDHLSRIDPEKCTACGECAKKCPVKVIEMTGSQK